VSRLLLQGLCVTREILNGGLSISSNKDPNTLKRGIFIWSNEDPNTETTYAQIGSISTADWPILPKKPKLLGSLLDLSHSRVVVPHYDCMP
jgi:hypothetical protein